MTTAEKVAIVRKRLGLTEKPKENQTGNTTAN